MEPRQQGARPFGVSPHGTFGKQGHVALAHDMKIDGIKRRHHENAGKQRLDFEISIKDTGDRARQHPSGKGGRSCPKRIDALNEQHGAKRRAKSNRSVGRNIREVKDAKGNKDTESEQRQNQADGQGADQ